MENGASLIFEIGSSILHILLIMRNGSLVIRRL